MSPPAKSGSKTTANGQTGVKLHAPRKLDIACGQNKRAGFKGIDIAGNADIVWNLFDFPWPIKTSSVQEVFCSHFIEHVPHQYPGWEKDGWFLFFDELHRIMKKDGVAEFLHPYNKSDRAFWDPTHVRFINETSWYYTNQEWLAMNGLNHYPADHNFEIVTIDATGIADEYMTRNMEQQNYARTHYWNVIPDLRVLIKALK